ncbi:MAG TPA: class I SAM-dependent methyltransferase [Candidatus Methylomirabilis sp.]|nr:class I SAM-dependent methyltransferase [Candidatus Methylomirabilis sp.]
MRSSLGRLADYGRPVPRETWDRQYRDGTWEWLGSIDEFAHYMVVAGYVRYLFASPTILDVGCGQGRLAELLAAASLTRYLGIDLSTEAIQVARRRVRTRARFRVADLNKWHPPGQFSVIVFCESLNYAIHPVSTLVRYAQALKRNGAIIVSLVRHRNHERIWTNAARHFHTADSTTVINPQGATWDICLLQPMRKAVSA